MPNKIYLDYASATPVDGKVLRLVAKTMKENFANAGAIHDLGVKSKKVLELARGEVAKIIGAQADEIIFTSGATESNNLAIMGVTQSFKKPHIVTTNIEHASVLEVCKYLELTKQAEVTYVPVEVNGIVDPQKIKKALRPNTVLVSVMYANNEIGTIQPIREIAKVIRNFKKNKIGKEGILEYGYFSAEKFLVLEPSLSQASKMPSLPLLHTDATQAVNYLDINILRLGVDTMSFNGGKIYGPKGVGALYIKRKTFLTKIMHGGEQEMGLRAGTENLPQIVGLTEALKIAENMKDKEVKRLITLCDYFFSKLSKMPFGIIINGDEKERLPNNVNITIPKIPSDLLVIELSTAGIYISEKSACKSGDKSESHVISAIRPNASDGSLRFSLGRSTTKQDIDYTLKTIERILTKLKKWYN